MVRDVRFNQPNRQYLAYHCWGLPPLRNVVDPADTQCTFQDLLWA